MLNTETDTLEESNREIREQIQIIHERGQLSEQEKENLKQSLQDQLAALEKETEESLIEAEDTKKGFKKIQVSVEKMVEMFKRSKFFLAVAQKMSYEEGFTFTENNVVQYLAELEEYIASLITYQAFKRDEPNAAISAIPLEQIG